MVRPCRVPSSGYLSGTTRSLLLAPTEGNECAVRPRLDGHVHDCAVVTDQHVTHQGGGWHAVRSGWKHQKRSGDTNGAEGRRTANSSIAE